MVAIISLRLGLFLYISPLEDSHIQDPVLGLRVFTKKVAQHRIVGLPAVQAFSPFFVPNGPEDNHQHSFLYVDWVVQHL